MNPIRTCIVCRTKGEKQNFIKISKTKDGTFHINKNIGRGAYICNSCECIKKAIDKKMLNKAFKKEVSADTYKLLSEVLNEQ